MREAWRRSPEKEFGRGAGRRTSWEGKKDRVNEDWERAAKFWQEIRGTRGVEGGEVEEGSALDFQVRPLLAWHISIFLMFNFILYWPMNIVLLFSLGSQSFLVVLVKYDYLRIMLCFGFLLYSWYSPINNLIHLWVWCLIVILLLSVCPTSFQPVYHSWNEALPNNSGLSFLLCF